MKFYFLFPMLLLIACTPENTNIIPSDDPLETHFDATCDDAYTVVAADLADQIQATTDFAFDMFKKSTELESGNLIQSPVSMYSALLMLYEGTDCDTKAQISRALHLGEAISTFPSPTESYSDFLDWLDDDSEAYSLKMANALFSDPSRINLLDPYKNKIDASYGAALEELDFSKQAALETINQWAADHTEGKVEEVLDEINDTDAAFLMNALYFKSDWELGFSLSNTKDGDFTTKDGEVLTAPLMFRDEYTLFDKGEVLDMVELPLKDNKYVANIFLPADKEVHIDQIIQAENFREVLVNSIEACEERRLFLTLPKFELSGKQDLKEALIALGMKDVFSEAKANLTAMGTGTNGKLYVDKAFHDTYIKLDEKGIEGAVVTTIGIALTSLPPSIRFDRPFAFVIRKADSHMPLFIGKVENPL